MSDAAAFKATYADWKLVKTRGVVQIVFELPIEKEKIAYAVLGGMPCAAEERWFAIARLNIGETGEAPPRITPGESTLQRDRAEGAAAGNAHLPNQNPSRTLS